MAEREAGFDDRFGTRALQRSLAAKQAEMIEAALPGILADTQKQLKGVEAELAALGEAPPTDAREVQRHFDRMAQGTNPPEVPTCSSL